MDTLEPKSYPSDLRLNDPQSFNPYVYCRNNPLKFVDPDGEVYYEKGTNNPLKDSEVAKLAFETLGKALKEEGLTLPFYYQFRFWQDLVSLSSGPEFKYGPKITSTEGEIYSFLRVNVGASNIPMNQARLSDNLGKTKEGEDILQISTGKGFEYTRHIIVTGTMEQLNEYLKEYGFEIVINERLSSETYGKEYELRENREEE